MVSGARVIIATTQHDMIVAIKNSLKSKHYIETILTVSHPSEAENKFMRTGMNILIWDLDETAPNPSWIRSASGRYSIFTFYTSLSGGKRVMLPNAGNELFVQKPAVFTAVTTWRFTESITEQLDVIVKRQKNPNMRELVKMVGANDRQKIVAIGSSTGGTNALEHIMKHMPSDMPPMIVVQHMPSGFTKLFADRLNALYSQDIREAQSGDFLMRGRMLIAPADRHIKLVKQQGKFAVECFVGTRIHGVMPAADILFESVAAVAGNNAVGVILTGMGSDGAKGLMKMKNVGCKIIAQDEASCVVYGMPKAAKDLGAITEELPIDKIPEAILRLSNG